MREGLGGLPGSGKEGREESLELSGAEAPCSPALVTRAGFVLSCFGLKSSLGLLTLLALTGHWGPGRLRWINQPPWGGGSRDGGGGLYQERREPASWVLVSSGPGCLAVPNPTSAHHQI